MSLHWHIPLPGPVAYSRPIRKRRGRNGLVGILVWFIVTPFKLLAKALGLAVKARPKTPPFVPPAELPAYRGWNGYPVQPGWYSLNGQAWYWTGTEWLA